MLTIILPETLLQHDDENLFYEFTEEIHRQLTARVDLLTYNEQLDDLVSQLPVEYRNILYISQLSAEVSNGGFLQYFYNSSHKHADDAWRGLLMIDADDAADILAKAIVQYQRHIQRFIRARADDGAYDDEGFSAMYAMNELHELHHELTHEFLVATNDGDKLIKMCGRYIRGHFHFAR